MHAALKFLLPISIFFSLASLALTTESTGASVQLPMSEYQKLLRQNEVPNLTSIQSVRLTGEYGKALEVRVEGVVSGKAEPVVLFSGANDLEVVGCTGTAVITRTPVEISLLPMADRFQVTCQISFRTWQENALLVRNSLSVQTQIANADVQTEAQGNDRQINFYRRSRSVASEGKAQEPSVNGRYRLSVLPDEIQFEYFFSIYNPNSSVFALAIPKVNQEIVQKISSSLEHSESEASVTLHLPPGDSEMIWRGRLLGASFKTPASKGRQMVLFENDPLLQVKLDGATKKMSLQDLGISPRFTGAQAFLMDKTESLQWQATPVEVFEGHQFTARYANYRLFWSPTTSTLAEAEFMIDNQGVAEIPLAAVGRVHYLEVNGTPQVLAKNSSGELLIRVPQGDNHLVLMQFEPEVGISRGLASLNSPLPQLKSVTSQSTVNLFGPSDYRLIFASGLGERSHTFAIAQILWGILGVLLCWNLLRGARLPKWQHGVLSTLFGFLCFLNWWLVLVPIAAEVWRARGLWLTPFLQWPRWQRLALVGAFLILGTATLILPRQGDGPSTPSQEMHLDASADRAVLPVPPPMAKGAQRTGRYMGKETEVPLSFGGTFSGKSDALESSHLAADSSQLSYQGLPTKISFPSGNQLAHFKAELLGQDFQPQIRAAVASQAFLIGTEWFLILAFGILVWRSRQSLGPMLSRRFAAKD